MLVFLHQKQKLRNNIKGTTKNTNNRIGIALETVVLKKSRMSIDQIFK